MHIVQIVPELNQGGVERGTVELNRELVRRCHRSSVISNGGRLVPTIEQDGGTHLTCDVCSKNPLTVPLRVQRLRRCLLQLRPDIIHVRSRVPAWLTAFANRTFRQPVVSTVHGFNSVNAYSAIMTKANRVVCGSPAIRDYVKEHYDVPDSRLRVVLRGIDTNYFNPAAVSEEEVQKLRAGWGLEGRFVVASVGRITPLKGHDLFLRAMAKARDQEPQLAGLIVGETRTDKEGYLNELETLSESLGVRDSVRFAGSRSDMREVYALSDLVVSATSAKPETFGRSVAEALAMNTPVVAAGHGGPLDIVLDGINGFFFEPGNIEACANAILHSVDADFSNLRPHIEANMSLDVMTESLLSIYHDVFLRKQGV